MKTLSLPFVAILFAVLLSGCIPDLKSDLPPDRVYWLEVPQISDPPGLDLRLTVVPGLDSDRIWLLQQDQRLNYYAGAYWPDNLRPLLESLLVRSLGARRGEPEVVVLIERYFAVDTGSGMVPDVVVRALLESEGARCRFERVEALDGDRLRDVVAGHQRALDALATAVAQFARSGRCA
jgi:hypothetical protein